MTSGETDLCERSVRFRLLSRFHTDFTPSTALPGSGGGSDPESRLLSTEIAAFNLGNLLLPNPPFWCSMTSAVELFVTPKLPTIPVADALLLRMACFPARSSHICQPF